MFVWVLGFAVVYVYCVVGVLCMAGTGLRVVWVQWSVCWVYRVYRVPCGGATVWWGYRVPCGGATVYRVPCGGAIAWRVYSVECLWCGGCTELTG